jgi:lipopolysaccharide biosynthesis regulator YciM
VAFALADLYEKKNDLIGAKEIYSKLIDIFPNSALPRLRLLKTNIKDKSLKEKLIEIEETVAHGNYCCEKCGFNIDAFVLLCPRCHAPESFLPCL